MDAEEFLSRGADANRFKPVEEVVPGFGTVYIRRLNTSQLDEYGKALREADASDTRATILLHAVGDSAGNPLFTSAALPKLRVIDGAVTNPIVSRFQKINRLVDDEKK